MRSMKVRLVLVLAAASFTLSGCPGEEEPSWRVTQTASRDPGFDMRHDWSPSVPIEMGVVNSCLERDSEAEGREHLCRVVDGYEEDPGNDDRNWIIHYEVGQPLAREDFMVPWLSQYGGVIVAHDGVVYEGCLINNGDTYVCDYRMRKPVVLHTGTDAWDFVLRKLWNWSRYVGNTLGCAGGIAGIWRGQPITLPMLTGCADGPL